MATGALTIGSNIKRIRDEKGVSATHITSQMGYTPQWLNNIEKNRRPIKADDLYKIANILGVDVGLFYDPNYNKAFKPTGTDCK